MLNSLFNPINLIPANETRYVRVQLILNSNFTRRCHNNNRHNVMLSLVHFAEIRTRRTSSSAPRRRSWRCAEAPRASRHLTSGPQRRSPNSSRNLWRCLIKLLRIIQPVEGVHTPSRPRQDPRLSRRRKPASTRCSNSTGRATGSPSSSCSGCSLLFCQSSIYYAVRFSLCLCFMNM